MSPWNETPERTIETPGVETAIPLLSALKPDVPGAGEFVPGTLFQLAEGTAPTTSVEESTCDGSGDAGSLPEKLMEMLSRVMSERRPESLKARIRGAERKAKEKKKNKQKKQKEKTKRKGSRGKITISMSRWSGQDDPLLYGHSHGRSRPPVCSCVVSAHMHHT